MQKQTKEELMEDVTRVAGNAAKTTGSLINKIVGKTKLCSEKIAKRMDAVPREEFQKLEAVVDVLNKRIEKLEAKKPAQKSKAKPVAKKAPAKKPATKAKKK